MVRQATIKKPFEISGKGLHTGQCCMLKFQPAPVNTGVVFIKDGIYIPASYKYVKDTKRRVVLERDGKKISTVEHLLSALYALGISNLFIYVNGEEIPILDGSAKIWLELFKKSEITFQDAYRDEFILKKVFSLREKGGMLILFPSERLEILSVISFPKTYIVWQKYYFHELDRYEEEIAPARTFGFYYEVENLLKSGLISGADLENALLIGENKYVNKPRFWDEPIRHKVLDIIGDFSLLGKLLRMKIISLGSGHFLHLKALELLEVEGGKGN